MPLGYLDTWVCQCVSSSLITHSLWSIHGLLVPRTPSCRTGSLNFLILRLILCEECFSHCHGHHAGQNCDKLQVGCERGEARETKGEGEAENKRSEGCLGSGHTLVWIQTQGDPSVSQGLFLEHATHNTMAHSPNQDSPVAPVRV